MWDKCQPSLPWHFTTSAKEGRTLVPLECKQQCTVAFTKERTTPRVYIPDDNNNKSLTEVLYLSKILIHKDPIHTRLFFTLTTWVAYRKQPNISEVGKKTEKKKDKKRKLNPPLWIAERDERTVTYVHDCAIRPSNRLQVHSNVALSLKMISRP